MEQLVQIASSTMKRVESITEIVTMRRNVSFRSLPMGFNWDTTKLKGFRVNMTYWQAFCSIIDPSHNEFWNITTDWVPMVMFFACAAYFYAANTAMPAPIREACAMSALFTGVQHTVSLVAHVFQCVSTRVSHSIWYIDYAGIILNFVWNGPSMVFLVCPGTSALWPAWRAFNFAVTAAILTNAVYFVATLDPSKDTDTRDRQRWICGARNAAVGALLILLAMPSEVSTLLLASSGDEYAIGGLVLLPIALLVKTLHYPERLYFTKGEPRYDFSLWHSHSIWHVLVWADQFCYAVLYARAMAAYDRSCGPDGAVDDAMPPPPMLEGLPSVVARAVGIASCSSPGCRFMR